MSGTQFELKPIHKNEPKYSNINQAILFILPSIIITIVSIILFAQLTVFPEPQYNIFLVTILVAIILSLVGMAGMQVLIYRIADDRDYFVDGAAARAIQMGLIYSFIVSIIMAAIVSPYLLSVLHFSGTDILYFAYLLFFFSSTWIIISAFWASEQYKQPAVIFTISYLGIFGFTYIAYQIDPVYTIIGYMVGITILFLASLFTALKTFPKPKSAYTLSRDFAKLPKLISQNAAPILFNIFYVLAIFLDKIIVWVTQGLRSGQGLVVTGPYTTGAFLGLIPMFSVATVAYFTSRTKSLVHDRYTGTFMEIQKGIKEYKRIYWISLRAMLLIALGLTVLIASLSFYFNTDLQVLQILLTISVGSIFFTVIVFNAAVLVIFGHSSISTWSVLIIIISELATIPYIHTDIWFSSLGFMLGSFIGFVVSFFVTIRMFSFPEYRMFRFLLKSP